MKNRILTKSETKKLNSIMFSSISNTKLLIDTIRKDILHSPEKIKNITENLDELLEFSKKLTEHDKKYMKE